MNNQQVNGTKWKRLYQKDTYDELLVSFHQLWDDCHPELVIHVIINGTTHWFGVPIFQHTSHLHIWFVDDHGVELAG